VKNLSDITSPNIHHIMSVRALLDDQIKNLFDTSPELKEIDKDQFEIAVSHLANVQYLNGIDSDDIIQGIVGAEGDEGIDMCYLFCNGILIQDEEHPITSDSTIKIKFFQAKKEDSFTVEGFRKLIEGIEEIFDLDLPLPELKIIGANENLLEKAELIRKVFFKASRERAKISCEVYYVTIAPSINNLPEKFKYLENKLIQNPFQIPFKFEYWGGQKLIDLNRKFDEKLEIKFDGQMLNILHKGISTTGKCGFVSGNDLMSCLIDKEKGFKSYLTEGNIRYFLGEDRKINKSIIETALDSNKAPVFWAMNNGITILGEDIVPVDTNTYSVKNPQIVNGCQTVHCLHRAYTTNNKNSLPPTLKVFVKLIQTGDDVNTQSDIISATNSQNAVRTASLKANDDVQKNIEIHLKKYGFYYERRENYYKQKGLKGAKVIGLLKLTQIVHSIANKESIVATNDTANLFSTNSKYQSIFYHGTDYDFYLYCVKLFTKVWSLKNSDLRQKKHSQDERDWISKGGFVLLHIISTLMFSQAEFNQKGVKTTEQVNYPWNIKKTPRKNTFTLRKKWLLGKLDDEDYMNSIYKEAVSIFKIAARLYATNNPDKPINSLFKNRSFDKDYVRPRITKYLDKAEKSN